MAETRRHIAKTHSFAILALISGILGIIFSWVLVFGLILGILSLVLGIISVNKIKKDSSLKGRGLAIAGIVLGAITIIVGLSVIGNMNQNTSAPSNNQNINTQNGIQTPTVTNTVETVKPECMNSSDCTQGSVCADNKCCKPECSGNVCSGFSYMTCVNANVCGKLVSGQLIKGKCGVVCTIDSDCGIGMKCLSNYTCSDYGTNTEIIAGDFKWTIQSFTTTSYIEQNQYMGKVADGEFLIVSVAVENIGNNAEYLSPDYLKLVDGQGREYSSDSTAWIYLPQGSAITFDTINPGIVKYGQIVYDVPKNLTVVNVRISNSLIDNSFYDVKLIS